MNRADADRAAALAASKASQAQAKRENAAHTPGPWRATEKTITAPETEDRLGMECRLYGGNGRDNRANARLIAGAPDLLAALQRIVAVLDKQVASPHLAERASPLAQAKAAIAKATGETA